MPPPLLLRSALLLLCLLAMHDITINIIPWVWVPGGLRSSSLVVVGGSEVNIDLVVDNPVKVDVTSTEFKSKAAATYAKVIPCLQRAWMMAGKNGSDWKFPDDAEHHFEEIKNLTERFRHAPVHEYAGYEGPWIENIFIRQFMHFPLHRFNGFIPIFVQWIDTQILRGRHFDNIGHQLNAILRPNVLYLAVSQGDVGLGWIGSSHPNILVLAAGGYGHVPIPLVRSEIPVAAHKGYSQSMGFFGNSAQASRPDVIRLVNEGIEMHKAQERGAPGQAQAFKVGRGTTWQIDMENTKFNLAPRGYGRSSFRFAEIVQMNRVPVFVYDDYPWIPYNGSAISAETFGFVAGLHVVNRFNANTTKSTKEYVRYDVSTNSFNRGMGIGLHDLVFYLNDMTDVQYQEKLKLVEKVRPYYTYEGVVAQIKKLIHDPFGPEGGFLTCSMNHPRSERCCDPDVRYNYDDLVPAGTPAVGKTRTRNRRSLRSRKTRTRGRRRLQTDATMDRLRIPRQNNLYNIKKKRGRNKLQHALNKGK